MVAAEKYTTWNSYNLKLAQVVMGRGYKYVKLTSQKFNVESSYNIE